MIPRLVLRTTARLSCPLLLKRHTPRLVSRPLPVIASSRRWMSTPPPQLSQSDLSIERYHELADATMDNLLDSLEAFVDELAITGYEVEYHSGVLTLVLGDKGTYVINKQPPNKQIWLSSPFSGPKRYDYSAQLDDWLYSRDNQSLGSLLEDELKQATGKHVQLDLKGLANRI